jgi:hypothetical protein
MLHSGSSRRAKFPGLPEPSSAKNIGLLEAYTETFYGTQNSRIRYSLLPLKMSEKFIEDLCEADKECLVDMEEFEKSPSVDLVSGDEPLPF